MHTLASNSYIHAQYSSIYWDAYKWGLPQHNLRVGHIGLGSADTLYGSPDYMVRGDGRQVCTLATREAIQSCAGDSPGDGLYIEAKKAIKVTLVT